MLINALELKKRFLYISVCGLPPSPAPFFLFEGVRICVRAVFRDRYTGIPICMVMSMHVPTVDLFFLREFYRRGNVEVFARAGEAFSMRRKIDRGKMTKMKN